ncbi:MAG: CBS domain-containing protein [Acidimicrobiales bacterium]|nr:CBS domain-containing protein [Acidimicrobiales bacterium]
MPVRRRPPKVPAGDIHDPVRTVTEFVVLTADENDTIDLVTRRMKLFDCGALLVKYKSGDTGILSERDILGAIAESQQHRTAGELATKDPLTIDAEKDIGAAAILMTVAGVRHLVVCDADTEGIVSLRDLVGPLLASATE